MDALTGGNYLRSHFGAGFFHVAIYWHCWCRICRCVLGRELGGERLSLSKWPPAERGLDIVGRNFFGAGSSSVTAGGHEVRRSGPGVRAQGLARPAQLAE